jgi:hypothetical protein
MNAGGYRGQRFTEENKKKPFQLDRAVPDPKGIIVSLRLFLSLYAYFDYLSSGVAPVM